MEQMMCEIRRPERTPEVQAVRDHHIVITAKGQEWAQVDAARPGVKQMGPGIYRG